MATASDSGKSKLRLINPHLPERDHAPPEHRNCDLKSAAWPPLRPFGHLPRRRWSLSATAAQFMAEVKRLIENPVTLAVPANTLVLGLI
jgi:hypothetical protein